MADSCMSAPWFVLFFDEEEDVAAWSRDESAVNQRIEKLIRYVNQAINHPFPQKELAKRLFHMLKMHMLIPLDDQRVLQSHWALMELTWRNGLRLLKPQHRIILENRIIDFVRNKLNETTTKLSQIEAIGRILAIMILPATGMEPPNLPAIVEFTQRIFGWQNPDSLDCLESAALKCDIITGGFNCLVGASNDMMKRIIDESSKNHTYDNDIELTKNSIISNGYKCLLKTSYLQKLLQRRYCNNMMENDYIQEEIIHVIQIFVIINTLYERFGFHPNYGAIQLIAQKIGFFIDGVIINLTKKSRKKILIRITKKSKVNKYYWVYGERYLEYKINKIEENPHFLDLEIMSGTEESSSDSTDSMESIENVWGSENSVTPPVKIKDIETECGFNSRQAQWRWGGPEDALRNRFHAALLGLRAAHENDEDVINELYLFEALMCSADFISPDVFFKAYSRNRDILLCARDLTAAPFLHVVSNGAIGEYLSEFVARRGQELSAKSWSFILSFLTSLVKSIIISLGQWGCTKVALITRATLKLFCSVQRFAANNHKQVHVLPNAPYVQFCQEWVSSDNSREKTKAYDIIWPIFSLYRQVLKSKDNNLNTGHIATLGALLEALRHLPLHQMKPREFVPEFVAESLYKARALYKLSARVAVTALQEYRHPSVKILAFKLLRALIMASDDHGRKKFYDYIDEEKKQQNTNLSLKSFEAAILPLQKTVSDKLSGVRECQKYLDLNPHSKDYSDILGYLMLSIALYEYCDSADGDLLQYHINHFRKNNYASFWIQNSLRLLPKPLLEYANDPTNLLLKPATYAKYFTETIDIPIEDACHRKTLDSLVCRCLFGALAGPGVEQARDWWNRSPTKINSLVTRLVSSYVSQPLLNKEFEDVESHPQLLRRAKITVFPNMSQAHCQIGINGDTINLIITYFNGHPLKEPNVTTSHPMAPNTSWLRPYLEQNGRLLNAFVMWINAAAWFQSNPKRKCFICYCYRDLVKGSPPSILCHRCRNVFHVGCKGTDTCQICR